MRACAAWTAALDAFERRLEEQAAVVAASEAGRQPDHAELMARCAFDPPVGLPPMPAELADRAEALLARSRLLQESLVGLLDATRPVRSLRPRHAAHRNPSEWDVRA